MKRTLAAGLAALLMASTAAIPSAAAPVKVGMITTLSGGGAGLGIDARDGFMLALKQAGDAGAEIDRHHRGRPAEARGRRPARRQDDPVRRRRHPDRHHLLEHRARRRPGRGEAGQVLPLGQRRPLAARRQGLRPELLQRRLPERQPARGDGRVRQHPRLQERLHPRPELPGRQGQRSTASSASTRASSPARSTPSSARPTSPPRSPRSRPPAPTASSSSCPAAWASPSSSSSPAPTPACR